MRFVYRSKLLCWLYCKTSQFRFRGFKKEIERRSKYGLFDYKEIAKPLPKCYYELCTDNNCFGVGYCIRNYVGSGKEYINAIIEHGYFFGRHVELQEKITFAKKILTFGDVRKEHISRVIHDKAIIPIGPYIHYAPYYQSTEQMISIKKELGRVLLVFFSHSGTGCSVSFDLDHIVSQINSIRSKYDSVVVSIFWSDINEEIEDRMKKEGYRIFSAGHRYDWHFLSRLKTMIWLSDMTMSNFVGTHIAYCTYMDKPHWIVRQKIREVALTEKGERIKALDERMSMDPDNQKEMNDFYNSFSDYKEVLTDKQKEVASKYFGFDYVRNVEEMRSVIL